MKAFVRTFKISRNELLGFLAILLAVLLFAVTPRGQETSLRFLDPLRSLSPREDVVIVGIDDTSLQTLGAWPWSRDIFGRLISSLEQAGVRAVVFDVLFLETRAGDEVFKKALETSTIPVILGAKKTDTNILESFLVTNSSNPLVTSALVNVSPSLDGKVRSYPETFATNKACITPLAEQAFRIATLKNKKDTCTSLEGHFRYPTSITTLPLVDVLNSQETFAVLKNSIVFIGSTSLDLEDHFISFSGEKIPGVSVHASILASLLENTTDKPLSTSKTAILVLLVACAVLLVTLRTQTLLGQLAVLGTSVGGILVVTLVLFVNHIEFPAPAVMVSVLSSGGYGILVRYIRERTKNKYIEQLFSKYVHKDVLQELLSSPKALHFEGEKKEVSVLFSDLRGFTTLSESLSPEGLTRIINAYFSSMTTPILEERGTIDKFIGDAIMAFWNAPLTVPHHEIHAVRSALRMHEALEQFNKAKGTSLAMGIGIHAGNVIVGNVGGEERVNYTILGDTVNLASRVEGLTKKYGVQTIVTSPVKEKLHDKHILVRKLDVITVKGKSEPTVLYEVVTKNAHKEEIFKRYEHAFALYQEKKFDEALVEFKALKEEGDGASEAMYERIPQVRNDSSFDGVWHFDEK